MRRFSLVLFVLAGLGSSISFALPAKQSAPFSRYLRSLKANKPEAALLRFGGECDIDIRQTQAKFAQRPASKWIPVNNLSHALSDQETDFYGTVEIWHSAERVLVEEWDMELDTGSYSRKFYCLQSGRITRAAQADWLIPVDGETKLNPIQKSQRDWKIGESGWAPKERHLDELELPSALLQ